MGTLAIISGAEEAEVAREEAGAVEEELPVAGEDWVKKNDMGTVDTEVAES